MVVRAYTDCWLRNPLGEIHLESVVCPNLAKIAEDKSIVCPVVIPLLSVVQVWYHHISHPRCKFTPLNRVRHKIGACDATSEP